MQEDEELLKLASTIMSRSTSLYPGLESAFVPQQPDLQSPPAAAGAGGKAEQTAAGSEAAAAASAKGAKAAVPPASAPASPSFGTYGDAAPGSPKHTLGAASGSPGHAGMPHLSTSGVIHTAIAITSMQKQCRLWLFACMSFCACMNRGH